MIQGSIQFSLPDKKYLVDKVLEKSGHATSSKGHAKLKKEAEISVSRIIKQVNPISIFKSDTIIRSNDQGINCENFFIKSTNDMDTVRMRFLSGKKSNKIQYDIKSFQLITWFCRHNAKDRNLWVFFFVWLKNRAINARRNDKMFFVM